jgi:hypothetical protein
MEQIIQQLGAYLLTVPQPKPVAGYLKIFTDKIKASELDSTMLKPHRNRYVDAVPSKTLIVNFNYTATLESYFDADDMAARNIELKYIHGTLHDDDMIFGFGDELDKRYQEMEEDKAKGWFVYVKSFWYFKTSNYRQLVRLQMVRTTK